MENSGSVCLLHQKLRNEQGVVFLLSILLLFLVTSAALLFINTFFSQLNSYNSLESIYVRATINILSSH